ncbi:hypothetical protein AXG93_2116s1130 [Marchantia polymorpha subsp. ruderalis]|uniref:Uncharacterized protein n=1 Tax=Marchantia polymorpha subsp. ruderalis TaxID=1480154 RepID=A0A176VKL2_MARPO|nr:hypothetical protein AXG93_2116s1130 [Marchantia polymorpha subsp. ruderalis]
MDQNLHDKPHDDAAIKSTMTPIDAFYGSSFAEDGRASSAYNMQRISMSAEEKEKNNSSMAREGSTIEQMRSVLTRDDPDTVLILITSKQTSRAEPS